MRIAITALFLLALMQTGNTAGLPCRLLFTVAGASIFICGQSVNAIPPGVRMCTARKGRMVCPTG